MRVLRAPFRWFGRHPLVTDSLLAAVLALLGVAGIPWDDLSRPPGLVLAVVLLQALPLAFGRKAPSTALLVASVGLFASYALGLRPTAAVLGPAVATYWTITRGGRPWASRAVLACVVPALAAPFLDSGETTAGDFFLVLSLYGLPWLAGSRIRATRDYTASLEQRAARLELEREAERTRAVLEERARIARELHDVVSHTVSVAVVQAGAAGRALAGDPERAREHVAAIESTGRQAMAELRRLLGVLRMDSGDDSDPLAPQPGIGEIEPLVGRVREAGLPVELEIEGDVRPLTPSLDLSAYRIVQEALTNTLRHAGPARAKVTIRYLPDALELCVADDGRGGASSDGTQGHGLVGMRERTALFGGTFEAGASSEGGYRVVARLPLDGTAP